MKCKKLRLAKVIRDRRAAEGYTQIELAEKTGISLRSIPRIKKGNVLSRSFTIKALEEVLKFSDEDLVTTLTETKLSSNSGKAKKIILSTSILPVLFLLAFAFLAQAPPFPETSFELALFWTAVISILEGLQWVIWTGKKG